MDREPLRVRALIEAAQAHLEEFGDTPVGIVVNGTGTAILHIEDAVSLDRDKYDPDEDAEWRFEIVANSEDYDGCVHAAARTTSIYNEDGGLTQESLDDLLGEEKKP